MVVPAERFRAGASIRLDPLPDDVRVTLRVLRHDASGRWRCQARR